MKKIKDFISIISASKKHCVDSNHLVADILATLPQMLSNHLFVLENNYIIGVFPFKEYLLNTVASSSQLHGVKVREFISKFVPTVSSDLSLEECLGLMKHKGTTCLAVKDNESIIGVVDLAFLIEKVLDEKNFLIDQLSTYINGTSMYQEKEVTQEEVFFCESNDMEAPLRFGDDGLVKAA
ncbi:MAG: CBS domain-containing protein [Bdellovibrionaceae bacterium]|nr:CBS domain-containing protein [Pseudobdellovibrionaceae bacterium]NUM59623.1 CBS domain-containing protein [Pseudobdellovibrionaceae bacterium]